MKLSTIYLTLCLILGFSFFGFAQTDSLTVGDTISVNGKISFFGPPRQYRYHHATALTSPQLLPLLERNADPEGKRLIRHYKTLYAIKMAIPRVTLGGLTGSFLLRRDNPLLARSLLVSSVVLTYVPLFIPVEKSMERAVRQYNGRLRGQSSSYYQPMVALIPRSERLTLADTIARKGSTRFVYRGIRVDPAQNLRPAFEYLNNRRLVANMRYVRTARTISVVASGFAAGFLASYVLGYSLRRSVSVGHTYPINRPLVYSMAGVIGAGIAFNWHLNRVQAGTVEEYNQQLKERLVSKEE
ncbi:hypothetical protein F5984_03955 [Rudanella paleaurantiibacter]|uniref:Uncharacterized protein n=1 Tax=Rudanella paleaurantiibacter TaxID=2614655 RepID=A0A7J5U625_9BACT|nr:hypothetical protein [Rudanella paleaurantiibacter]KAB7733101.1 hypothetical protein F5984_03955 [Rudanella paleaurantiibacter]